MEKKTYLTPAVAVSTIELTTLIAQSLRTSSNVFPSGTVTGGSGPNRARSRDTWASGWDN